MYVCTYARMHVCIHTSKAAVLVRIYTADRRMMGIQGHHEEETLQFGFLALAASQCEFTG